MKFINIFDDIFEQYIATHFIFTDLFKIRCISKLFKNNLSEKILFNRYPILYRYIIESKININDVINSSYFTHKTFISLLKNIELGKKFQYDPPHNFEPFSHNRESMFANFKLYKILMIMAKDMSHNKYNYHLRLNMVNLFKNVIVRNNNFKSDKYIFGTLYPLIKSYPGNLWYNITINLYSIFENIVLLRLGYYKLFDESINNNVNIEYIDDNNFGLLKSIDVLIFIIRITEELEIKLYILYEIFHVVTNMKESIQKKELIKALLSKVSFYKRDINNCISISKKFKGKFFKKIKDFRKNY